MNFYDENGQGVITKKDLKALKKAGYLGDLTPAQAYKQLDVNKDGVADPYETARLFGGQGLSSGGGGGGTLPFGFGAANPYAGFGMAPSFGGAYPPNAFQNFGMSGMNGMGGGGGPGVPSGPGGPGGPLNGINGLNNYPAFQQDFLSGGFGGPGGPGAGPAGMQGGGFPGYGF